MLSVTATQFDLMVAGPIDWEEQTAVWLLHPGMGRLLGSNNKSPGTKIYANPEA